MESSQVLNLESSAEQLSVEKKEIGISDKDILTIHLDYFFDSQKSPIQNIMNHIEKEILIQALLRFEGNQRKAAQFLGLKANTLNFKIKKHKIRFRKIIV